MRFNRATTDAVAAIAICGAAGLLTADASTGFVGSSSIARHHTKRACKAPGAVGVARNRFAQVLFAEDIVDSAVYVCPVHAGKVGRRFTLLEGSQGSQGGDPVGFVALSGPFVTVDRSNYFGPTDPTPPTTTTTIYDVRHPRRRGVEIGNLGFTLAGAKLTAAVAVGGACAWLETGKGSAGHALVRSILHARDQGGARVLDVGTIAPSSVSVAAGVVGWVNAGVRKTTKLKP